MDIESAETHDGLMDLFRDNESSEFVQAAVHDVDVRIWALRTPFPSAASRRQEPLPWQCLILTLPSFQSVGNNMNDSQERVFLKEEETPQTNTQT